MLNSPCRCFDFDLFPMNRHIQTLLHESSKMLYSKIMINSQLFHFLQAFFSQILQHFHALFLKHKNENLPENRWMETELMIQLQCTANM